MSGMDEGGEEEGEEPAEGDGLTATAAPADHPTPPWRRHPHLVHERYTGPHIRT